MIKTDFCMFLRGEDYTVQSLISHSMLFNSDIQRSRNNTVLVISGTIIA